LHGSYSVSTGRPDGFCRKKNAREYLAGIALNLRGFRLKSNMSPMLVEVLSVVPRLPRFHVFSTNLTMLPKP
jgi:hypothetical protein